MAPGILVPSAEQKQSGSVHWFGSQSGALLGSVSTAVGGKEVINRLLLAVWCISIGLKYH